VVCDPAAEMPLELDNKSLTLLELLEALRHQEASADGEAIREAA